MAKRTLSFKQLQSKKGIFKQLKQLKTATTQFSNGKSVAETYASFTLTAAKTSMRAAPKGRGGKGPKKELG